MKYFLFLVLGFSFVFTASALRLDPRQMTNTGEFVPMRCEIWNDGCNDCEKTDLGYLCPPKTCATMGMGYCRQYDRVTQPRIIELEEAQKQIPPANCQRWFDGCNTCAHFANGGSSCTLMACESYAQPKCLDESNPPRLEPMDPKIPLNCTSWFDGCNTCAVVNGNSTVCTQRECMSLPSEAYCKFYEDKIDTDFEVPVTITPSGVPGVSSGWNPEEPVSSPPAKPNYKGIPFNCLSWFDGCNTCTVRNGQIGGCTRKFCSEISQSYCIKLWESPDPLRLSVPFSGNGSPSLNPTEPKPS